MVAYFVYYSFKINGNSGDGNVDVKIEGPISSIDRIRKLERGIKEKFNYDSVVVINP
jgi:hypothetical protein